MVVTRFAPSPTGNLNIGGWRSGFFAYLFTRHNNGTFIVRIENTDKERSKPEYEKNIFESLEWMGISVDETYRQTDNIERHTKFLEELIEKDCAYISKEQPKEKGERSEVIRFRNPNKKITFNDMVRGEITFDTSELGDFVVAKSLTEPIFHFALAVDDWDEGVTHVIRGEDHISNTPRQILIQEAIGAPRPIYAHLPLILGKDRTKLSKRKGAKAITEYRDLGYLSEAILNYDAFLGWHPGGSQEIFSSTELIERFSLEQVQKSPAIFDEVKLLWFNREHMLRLSIETFWKQAKQFLSKETVQGLEEKKLWQEVVALMRERVQIFGELRAMDQEGEWGYFIEEPLYPAEKLLPKGNEGQEGRAATKTRLEAVLGLIKRLSEASWNSGTVKDAVWKHAEKEGKGNVLWPMRFALSGKEKSPDPFTIAGIIGKNETEKRIERAIDSLAS